MAERAAITSDHTEILEAALGYFEEGLAVLDADSRVLLWNQAAAEISGYLSAEMLSRALPDDLYQITPHPAQPHEIGSAERPVPIHLRHRQGHVMPAMLRRTPLRDALGKRFGTLLRFHPMEEIDALPHGARDEDSGPEHHIEQSQASMEERLVEAWQEWTSNAVPFGLLWITVDQGAMLRKTHGRDACEAMLGVVERTLLHGLRPAELLARWGGHEFLALCHERTAEQLEAHALRLSEVARTADFRWWGDRVAITVSIGSAQAGETETLSAMLTWAQQRMQKRLILADNEFRNTEPGGPACSQS